jgi:hypothetical protein
MFKKPVYLALFILINLGFLLTAYEGQTQGVINLPQTGQTKCYNASGAEIPCSGTGQDGEFQVGVDWPDPRFTVSGDCVTDNLTGLMWAKNGNLPNEARTWQGALEYVTSLNSTGVLCGYTDWRLPNINELESLINAGEADFAAWLNSQGFINVPHDDLYGLYGYWSSTTIAITVGFSNEEAWIVLFPEGGLNSAIKSYSGSVYVWPVRSGQLNNPDSQYPANIWKTGQTISYASGDDGDLKRGVTWPTPRFTDNGDGTVTDNLTDLKWTKDANAPGPASCSPSTVKKWQDTLDYLKCLNTNSYLGYNDWRLPNRKELFSLIDHSNHHPALPLDHPFLNVNNNISLSLYGYWSSSTSTKFKDHAWALDICEGFVLAEWLDFGQKTTGNHVWPVRPGPTVGERVSAPSTPTGPTSGTVGNSYTFTTGGSISSLGHSVQYQFDWGDGTNSGWLPVGTTSASHPWSSAGNYPVKTQARCATDTSVLSSWSSSISVNIGAPITYTLTTSVNPQGAGTVTLNPAGGTYTAGTTVTLTATPNSGYTFSSWSGDLTGSINPAQITMDGNKSVTAVFLLIKVEEDNPAITYTGTHGILTLLLHAAEVL